MLAMSMKATEVCCKLGRVWLIVCIASWMSGLSGCGSTQHHTADMALFVDTLALPQREASRLRTVLTSSQEASKGLSSLALVSVHYGPEWRTLSVREYAITDRALVCTEHELTGIESTSTLRYRTEDPAAIATFFEIKNQLWSESPLPEPGKPLTSNPMWIAYMAADEPEPLRVPYPYSTLSVFTMAYTVDRLSTFMSPEAHEEQGVMTRLAQGIARGNVRRVMAVLWGALQPHDQDESPSTLAYMKGIVASENRFAPSVRLYAHVMLGYFDLKQEVSYLISRVE